MGAVDAGVSVTSGDCGALPAAVIGEQNAIGDAVAAVVDIDEDIDATPGVAAFDNTTVAIGVGVVDEL